MEEELIWRAPPPHVNRRLESPVGTRKITAMRENPNEWLEVTTFDKGYKASAVATDIRKKKFEDIQDPENWEMRTKRVSNDDGTETSTLWMRYISKGSHQGTDDDVLEELDQESA